MRLPDKEITSSEHSWYVSNVGPIHLLASDPEPRARGRGYRTPDRGLERRAPALSGVVIGWLEFGAGDPWAHIADRYARSWLKPFSASPALTSEILEGLRSAEKGITNLLAKACAQELRRHKLVPTTCRGLWLDRHTNSLTRPTKFNEFVAKLADMSVDISLPKMTKLAIRERAHSLPSPGGRRPS